MNDQRKTKKQLLEELGRERERSLALAEVSKRVAGAHDTDQVLDLIVNEATRLVGASGAFIRLLDGDVLLIGPATESSAGYAAANAESNPAIPAGQSSMTGRILEGRKPKLSEDVSQDEGLYPTTFDLARKFEIRGTVLVPLMANDRPLGVLNVWDHRVRRFTDEEVSLISAFADQASLALEKARLLNEAERERERLLALADVVADLATTSDFEAVSQKITDSARSLVGARIAIIFQLDQSTGILSRISLSGESHPRFTQDFSLADLGSVRAFAARERQTIVTSDILVDKRLNHTLEQQASLEQFELRAVIGVPFIVQGRVTGVLVVSDPVGRIFSDDEITLTESLANQASLALEKTRSLRESDARERQATQLYEVTAQLAANHDLEAFWN